MKFAGLFLLLPLMAGCAFGRAVPIPSAVIPMNTSTVDMFVFEQNKRLGRGVNLGNALEAPVEGEWGVVLEEEFFQRTREGGFQTVRVPIRWNAHALPDAPYTIAPAFFARVDWVLEQAHKYDLNIILNIHHYNEMIEDPVGQKERFIAIWRQIAERYKNEPDSVFFELLNEPHGDFASSGAWNKLIAETIPVVRATNPHRTIIVGPGNWNALSELSDLMLPKDDRNIIVTFHYYLPFHFTHQGAEWAENSNTWLGTTWRGTQEEQEAVRRDLNLAAAWSAEQGRPLFMGEFGAYYKADMDSRILWTAFLAREAETRGFSWAYWEFCAGFGVYDRKTAAWVDSIYHALIP